MGKNAFCAKEYAKQMRENAVKDNNGNVICSVELWEQIASIIESTTDADVVEVRHGEWKPIVIQESYFDPPYCDTCKCSMCEYEIDVSETVYNYCPNCGAKMDGKGDGD